MTRGSGAIRSTARRGRTPRRRRAVPARGDARRLHRAQRDDPRRTRTTPTGTRSPISPATRRGAPSAMRALLRAPRALPAPRRSSALLGAARARTRAGHGWYGWLHDRAGDPASGVPRSTICARTILDRRDAACGAPSWPRRCERARWLESQLDPNDWRVVSRTTRRPPLHAADDARPPARRRARARARRGAAASRSPADRAARAGDARAVRRRQRAVGVEYPSGERLYRAHARPSAGAGRACAGAAPRAR